MIFDRMFLILTLGFTLIWYSLGYVCEAPIWDKHLKELFYDLHISQQGTDIVDQHLFDFLGAFLNSNIFKMVNSQIYSKTSATKEEISQ